MELTRLAMTVLVLALVAAQPVRADYEAGQRAWDAGRPDEAVVQWEAAADAGDRRAMLALGRLYLQGLGVIQDYVEAHKWLNLAGSRGEAAALKERDALAGKMTPAQIATAQERAAAWRPGADRADGAPDTAVARTAAAVPTPAPDASPPPPRAIREAQTLLGMLGYRAGPADGVWGRRTGEAYRAFLQDAGLPASETLTPEALGAMRAVTRGGAGAETGHGTTPAAVAAKTPSETSAPRPTPVRPDALHRAAQTGDIDVLKAVLEAGVDIDARDGRSWTALMHAVNNGYILLVDSLLAARGDADIRAPDGATALFMAALYGHAEIFARLVEAGADASIPGPQGRTPLDVAQLKGDSKFLALPVIVALLDRERTRKEREEAAQRDEAESAVFLQAKSSGTPLAYKNYLSAWCPGGNFCGVARTRLDYLVREYISGKSFSGPLLDGRLTLQFSSSGVFKIHLLGGAVPSGTWRVDSGKVLMDYSEFFGMYRVDGKAELDGDVLIGHFDWKDGRRSWRLHVDHVEDVTSLRRGVPR